MADFTAETITLLQPLIKKPTLKQALLQKPPFRFLHDIVTNLQASPSAFPPASLFAADQLNSEQVKEKEQKIAFLQRVLQVVTAVNGSPVDVNVGKIIAGLEPEKTNDFLRALAKAAQGGLSEAEVIQRVDGGDTKKKDEAKPAPAPAAAAAAPAPGKKAAAASPPAAAASAKTATPAPAAASAAKPAAATPSPKIAAAAAPVTAVKAPAAAQSTAAAVSASPSPLPSSRAAAIALPPAPSLAEDYTATTQRLLGALITKPSLKPALLQKPPFRFLHDIVTALIASAAHYPADFFTADELSSAAFDTSEKKVAFLRRLIDVVEATGPFDLSAVNPKKIVAGLEPEQTNLLLQALAQAAASGVTAVEALAKKAGGPAKAAPPKEVTKPAVKEEKPVERAAEPAAAKAAPSKAAPLKASPAALAASPAVPKLALQSMETEAVPAIVPSSSAVPAEDDGGQRLERPMTARQGPPKAKPTSADPIPVKEPPTPLANFDPPSVKSSSKAAAVVEKKKGLILEGEAVEEEAEDIAEEEPTTAADEDAKAESLKAFEEEKVDVSAQGGLMRKILQANEAHEQKEAPAPLGPSPEAAKGDDRAAALRAQLQKLCHSIAPLGKCFEFVVDDVDEMGREMARWRQQREEYSAGLEDARRHTARVVEPLQHQLEEAERKLEEWEKRILAIQCTLWTNEQTVTRLIEQKVAVDQ